MARMQNDHEIFTFLFILAETSKDPEGVVAACLLRDDQLLASSASSDDGRHHAEYLLVQQLREQGIAVDERCVLYTTLAPCSDTSAVNDGCNCTTSLLEAGVRHVVFAADDPEWGKNAKARFRAAGGTYRQTDDQELVRRAARLFNATISRDLSGLHLPRERKLETTDSQHPLPVVLNRLEKSSSRRQVIMFESDAFRNVWAPRLISIVRIFLGLLYMQHGLSKYFGFPAPAPKNFEMLSLIGLAGAIEIIGGFMLALGIYTRWVAFIISGEMAVAFLIVRHRLSVSLFPLVSGGQLEAVYSFFFFLFFLIGGGAWALDRLRKQP